MYSATFEMASPGLLELRFLIIARTILRALHCHGWSAYFRRRVQSSVQRQIVECLLTAVLCPCECTCVYVLLHAAYVLEHMSWILCALIHVLEYMMIHAAYALEVK